MRYHVASLSRAKTIARNLSDLAKSIAGCDILLTDAQGAVAQILGYQNWAELKSVVSAQAQGSLTDLDEMLPTGNLEERLRHQADVLMACFGFHREAAALIVAHLRATAHPAGPHRVEGPSSRLSIRGTSREFRGTHADGRPILLVDGCERHLVLRVEPVTAAEPDTSDPYHASKFLSDDCTLRVSAGKPSGIFSSLEGNRQNLDGRHDRLSATYSLHPLREMLPESSHGHGKGCLPAKGICPSITIFQDDRWQTLVARLPNSRIGNPVLRLRIGTDTKFGLLEISVALLGQLLPEQIADEDGMPTDTKVDMLTWLDACGLKVPSSHAWNPRHWTEELRWNVNRDRESQVAWRNILDGVDLSGIQARIDVDAIQWLADTNDPFLASDVDAYNALRNVPGNEAARTCLQEWPALFGSVWASPEFRRANLPLDEIRRRLVCEGTSTSHGRCERGIPPLPEYVLDWLRHRRGLGGQTNFGGYLDILEALTVLGPDRLPQSNRDFYALEEIFRHLCRCVPSPARTIGADALHRMMLAASAKMYSEQGVGAAPEMIL